MISSSTSLLYNVNFNTEVQEKPNNGFTIYAIADTVLFEPIGYIDCEVNTKLHYGYIKELYIQKKSFMQELEKTLQNKALEKFDEYKCAKIFEFFTRPQENFFTTYIRVSDQKEAIGAIECAFDEQKERWTITKKYIQDSYRHKTLTQCLQSIITTQSKKIIPTQTSKDLLSIADYLK